MLGLGSTSFYFLLRLSWACMALEPLEPRPLHRRPTPVRQSGILPSRHHPWHRGGEIPWLRGFGSSRPVRIGNGAYIQHQMDIYGEIVDALQCAHEHGLRADDDAWQVQRALLQFAASHWRDPCTGIWEQRSRDRHYTHSKVMCWVAFDRAIRSAERFRLEGPVSAWKQIRRAIHEDVCMRGYSRKLGTFVQYYGGKALDASLLLIPIVGFLPATDPRVCATVEAIERELTVRGFVYRYGAGGNDDGFEPGEGAFLACSLWLADCLVLMGRERDARKLFERVLAVRNDIGLLAEEYDPVARRQLGNFPQAFSHVGVINTARNLSHAHGPAKSRARGTPMSAINREASRSRDEKAHTAGYHKL
jgi:GH15 family glucan-1,4-alpha-glucosidase